MADQQWEIRYSNTRSRAYFYNHKSNQSSWETPNNLTELELLSLPGAHFLSNHPTKPNPPPAASSNKVRASHLLIKHKDSRRASSWKQSVITRTKSEAIEILKQHQLYLNDSPDLATAFAELAQRESDCSSARDGGDLGYFGPKQMQKPFEDATFATSIGHMSDIISTDSGVHLILRTA